MSMRRSKSLGALPGEMPSRRLKGLDEFQSPRPLAKASVRIGPLARLGFAIGVLLGLAAMMLLGHG
jgi:hypothetical protein